MASTSNRNTPGDYKLELKAYNDICGYSTMPSYGIPQKPLMAGDGLLAGHMSYDQLAHNGKDIESYLFGIGSTNLIDPKPMIDPQYKQPKSLNIIDRIPLIIPAPLTVQPNQRPYPLN